MKIDQIIKFAANMPTNPSDQRAAASFKVEDAINVEVLSALPPAELNEQLATINTTVTFENVQGEKLEISLAEFESLYSSLVKLCPGARLAKDEVILVRTNARNAVFAARRDAAELAKSSSQAERDAAKAKREAESLVKKAEREAAKAKREAELADRKAKSELAKTEAAAKLAAATKAKEEAKAKAEKEAKAKAEKEAKAKVKPAKK